MQSSIFYLRGSVSSWRKIVFITFLGAAAISLGASSFARSRHHGELEKRQKAEEPAPPAGPLFFVISTGKQHVSVYGRNGLYARSPVSTGRPDHPTPLGLFTILEKERYHHSNIYSGAPMPYMQRITYSGVAMHEGVLPGYAASHGCIRMPHEFARRMFGYTQGNEHVIISRQDVQPVSISHPRLPEPKLMTFPGPDNIASGSAQLLQNALASVGLSSRAGGAEKVDVAIKADAKTSADDTGQKLLNPLEFAKAMKARAARTETEAAAALGPARGIIEAKAKEVRDAAIAVRKAEIALSNSKDRAEAAAKDLQAASADDAVKAKAAAKAEADAKIKEAEELLAASQRTKTEKEQDAVAAVKAYKDVESARKTAALAVKSWGRRLAPVSVFVSRKTHRLYIRQGFVKVFDVPVTIRDPEKPLGTHLFVAMPPEQAQSSSPALRWLVLTIPDAATETLENSRGRRRHRHRYGDDDEDAPRLTTQGASAAEALDRIEFSPEVESQISGMLWAGGTLLVSDSGLSGETGDHTDFVILTR